MPTDVRFLVELWVGKPYFDGAQSWLRMTFGDMKTAQSVYDDPKAYMIKMHMRRDLSRLSRVEATCWVALYAEGIIDLERTYLPPEAAPAVEPPTPQPGGRPVLRIVRD